MDMRRIEDATAQAHRDAASGRRRYGSDVEAVPDLGAQEALAAREEVAGEGKEERAQLAPQPAARHVRVQAPWREARERLSRECVATTLGDGRLLWSRDTEGAPSA